MATKKQMKQKEIGQEQKKVNQQEKKLDHAAKAIQVKAAYKTSVEGMVKTGMILADYRAELADDREFARFWRDTLHWPKSTVYRQVDVGTHFSHLPGQTLAYFDLSAIYLLATKKVKAGLRTRAIKKAEKGEFVSHAQVREWLGKQGKPTGQTIPSRPGTIRINMATLTAEAKKVKINAAKVLELLERLGVTVEPVKEQPSGAKATGKPKKEVA